MKKMIVFCLMLCFLKMQIPVEASAAKVLSVSVNGQVLNLSVPPIVEGKEVLLPAKELIEALGGTYFWVSSSKILAIKKDNLKIGLPLNTNTAILNGETVTLKAAPKLIKNRMYVPAKFVCESLGASYVYDVPKNTVRIETAMVLSIMKDESIGLRLNDTSSGAWWGENIAQIARTSDTTFTSVLSSESGQHMAYIRSAHMTILKLRIKTTGSQQRSTLTAV